MKNSPRLVVWGLGPHAIKNILPAINALDTLSLYGICSRTELVVTDCAKRLECKSWTNPVQMLEDPLVDVVYLATPIGLHSTHGKWF